MAILLQSWRRGIFRSFEVLGLEVVELGDVLSGDLTHPGLGLLRNESKCENLNVDIRECHCSPWQADKLLNQH